MTVLNRDLIDGININIDRVEVLFRITRLCNQSCIFCSVETDTHTIHPYDNITDTIDEIAITYKWNTIEFVVTWWEPTLHPRFADIVEYLYKKWFYIKLQTNAVYFWNERNFLRTKDYFDKIDFFISFHSHNEKVYDFLTWSKWQFNIAVKGIKNIISALDEDIELNIVLSSLNVKLLKVYFAFLGKNFWGGKNYTVNISCLTNIAKYSYGKTLLARFSDIKDSINASQAIVEAFDIQIRRAFGGECDIPFCIAQHLFYYDDMLYSKEKITNNRKKLDNCSLCQYNDYCSWVLSLYIEKYGEEEFVPIEK